MLAIIFFAFFFSSASAQFIQAPEQLSGNYNTNVINHFSGLLPTELLDFYSNLTPQQEKIMDKAVTDNEGDENGFIGYINKKDPELGERANRVFKDFIGRLANLKPAAQQFYLSVSSSLHFTHFLFSSSTLSVKLTVQQARKP
jgi:hypothetical protein